MTVDRTKRIRDVLRVASGNFLEQYDFFIYAYYAGYIGKAFFPSDNPVTSLLQSFAVFGVGFLMRPLGAIVLGAFIDRVGRRLGLIVTLSLMALGTLSIAVTPDYAAIGVAAPLIILTGRLLQGFSAGAELGGVSVYLAEIATPGNRGLYCSWQAASQQVAVIFAALLGVALTSSLSDDQMARFGWRIPLLIGCGIVPLIFWLRRSLRETEAFTHATGKPRSFGAAIRMLAGHWPLVLTSAAMTVLNITVFYLITAYTPTYGRTALHLGSSGVLAVTLLVGVSNFIWLPVGGMISDRIGRYPMLIAVPVVTALTAYPCLLWLVAAPTFGKLTAVVLLFSALFGLYSSTVLTLLTEIMPPAVRTTGFSVAYSLAAALFGGFTPYISTWLIERTGDRAAPGLWLSFAALVSLAGVLISRRTARAVGFAEAPPAPLTPSAAYRG